MDVEKVKAWIKKFAEFLAAQGKPTAGANLLEALQTVDLMDEFTKDPANALPGEVLGLTGGFFNTTEVEFNIVVNGVPVPVRYKLSNALAIIAFAGGLALFATKE